MQALMLRRNAHDRYQNADEQTDIAQDESGDGHASPSLRLLGMVDLAKTDMAKDDGQNSADETQDGNPTQEHAHDAQDKSGYP
jgi:hypothetical protein